MDHRIGLADQPLERSAVVEVARDLGQARARGLLAPCELDQYGAGLTGKTEVIALTKSDLIDDKARGKIVKALEKEAGARVFPISAPLDEGLEPLLDAIIQRLGAAAEDERLEAADEGSWSPL